MDATLNSRSRPRRGLWSLNLLLLVLQAFAGVIVSVIMATRGEFVSLSAQVSGPDAPLMNSVLADLLVRKEAILLVAVILLIQVWKESKIESLRTRLLLNVVGLSALAGLQAVLVSVLYSPINVAG